MFKRFLIPLMIISSILILTGCNSTEERVSVPYVITGNRNSGAAASTADTSNRRAITTGVQSPAEAAPQEAAETAAPVQTPAASEPQPAPASVLPQIDDFFTATGESVPDYCLLAEGDSPSILYTPDIASDAAQREASYQVLLYRGSYAGADIEDYARRTAIENRTPIALYSTVSRYEDANVLLFAEMDIMEMLYYSTIGIKCEDSASGALVSTVFSGTPAEGSLERGDIITAVNGSRVTDSASFKAITDPIIDGSDRSVDISYRRNGASATVTLTL